MSYNYADVQVGDLVHVGAEDYGGGHYALVVPNSFEDDIVKFAEFTFVLNGRRTRYIIGGHNYTLVCHNPPALLKWVLNV